MAAKDLHSRMVNPSPSFTYRASSVLRPALIDYLYSFPQLLFRLRLGFRFFYFKGGCRQNSCSSCESRVFALVQRPEVICVDSISHSAWQAVS